MMSACVERLGLGIAAVMAVFVGVPAASADRPTLASSEFPTETAALIAVTTAFFDAAERATNDTQKPGQPVIGLPNVVSPANVQNADPAIEKLTNHGAVRHLTGYRIDWYPMSHLLGTVDFMGTWNNNRNLVCGYVTWDFGVPDAPVLDSIEANYLDLTELASVSPRKVHQTLLEANCAFGAIDANYAFFEPAN